MLSSFENILLIGADGEIVSSEPNRLAVEFTQFDLDCYHSGSLSSTKLMSRRMQSRHSPPLGIRRLLH